VEEEAAGVVAGGSVAYRGEYYVDPLTGTVVRGELPPAARVNRTTRTGAAVKTGKSAKPPAASAASAAGPATSSADDGVPVTGALYPTLKRVLGLFALHTLQQDMAFYLRHGYFTPQVRTLRAAPLFFPCVRRHCPYNVCGTCPAPDLPCPCPALPCPTPAARRMD
jgi:hypothetical protein